MQTSTQEQLSRTFLEVVEQLTFMFGEPEGKDQLEVGGFDFMTAAINFQGDLNGELTIAVPDNITAEIAANILGLEPEDVQSEEMRCDALAEMLNVVCGHVIMAIAGTDANFKLGAPVTGQAERDKLDLMIDSDDYMGLILDDNPVFLGLVLEN